MMTPWITEPGAYDLTDDQYHADPVVGGSLSSSGARTLLRPGGPARFAYEREHGRPDRNYYDLGHVVHHVVLGVGKPYRVVDTNDRRTKAWRQAEEAARAAGETPLPRDVAVQAYGMAAALLDHPVVGPMLRRPGRAEQSFVARCPDTGIMCRARFDYLIDGVPEGDPVIGVDVKTASKADPEGFARAMADHGYHEQFAWYEAVLQWLGRCPFGIQMIVATVETAPPHLVSFGWSDDLARYYAGQRMLKARDIYRQCTELDQWPGYPEDGVEYRLPVWTQRDYEAADYRIGADAVVDATILPEWADA